MGKNLWSLLSMQDKHFIIKSLFTTLTISLFLQFRRKIGSKTERKANYLSSLREYSYTSGNWPTYNVIILICYWDMVGVKKPKKESSSNEQHLQPLGISRVVLLIQTCATMHIYCPHRWIKFSKKSSREFHTQIVHYWSSMKWLLLRIQYRDTQSLRKFPILFTTLTEGKFSQKNFCLRFGVGVNIPLRTSEYNNMQEVQ